MSIDLPLNNTTFAEKLEAMEAIWADLSRRPADLPAPVWHKEILDERRNLVAEGKLKFLDWDAAIADLRKELRGNSSTVCPASTGSPKDTCTIWRPTQSRRVRPLHGSP
jgi:hypothetical protein